MFVIICNKPAVWKLNFLRRQIKHTYIYTYTYKHSKNMKEKSIQTLIIS